MKTKTYKIASLGCRTNQYEAEAFARQLAHLGYKEAKEGETAEVCIVNTCTVTESADSHSRHAIRSLVKENKDAKLFVTGCYAERDASFVASMSGVTKVVSNKDKEELLKHLHPEDELPEFKIERERAKTRAFVKVQDGCNSFCTYCIIPYVRGRSQSRAHAAILSEIRGLLANGYKEIVLTGINIGDYDGGDGSHTLADLVVDVDQLEGIERLRLSSIDPDEVDEDLLSAIVDSKHTAPSMHIVLQSGSNKILKRMNRKYTKEIFLQTCETLLQKIPRFTFTTDVIVGFPGETCEDFEETLSLIERIRFAKVHMFPYSKRNRTKAALYPDQVPIDIVKERKARLIRASELAAFQKREEFIGLETTVLIEEVSGERASGYSDEFIYVTLDSNQLASNDLVRVKLTQNTPKEMVGIQCI